MYEHLDFAELLALDMRGSRRHREDGDDRWGPGGPPFGFDDPSGSNMTATQQARAHRSSQGDNGASDAGNGAHPVNNATNHCVDTDAAALDLMQHILGLEAARSLMHQLEDSHPAAVIATPPQCNCCTSGTTSSA